MSEQSLPDKRLLEVVRDAVSTSPEPPRHVSTSRILVGIYRGSAPLITASAVMAGIALWSYFLSGSELARWGLVIFFAAASFILLTLPAMSAAGVARMARAGLATHAVVREAALGRNSVKRWPSASGLWTVHHPELGEIRESFEIEAPWANRIVDGAVLDVLVFPGERKSVLAIGIASSTHPDR